MFLLAAVAVSLNWSLLRGGCRWSSRSCSSIEENAALGDEFELVLGAPSSRFFFSVSY